MQLCVGCSVLCSVIEECRVPVVAAVVGGCVGAGVDLVSACDIRIASADAWFTVKEVDIGLAADLGMLSTQHIHNIPQHLPHTNVPHRLCRLEGTLLTLIPDLHTDICIYLYTHAGHS
eukprot:GHVQ01020692.1.p3 GENE.GHVQ01020692.1~~GHVQ01020692.1.p3  ORF type:complete len:118 (+),score=21.61 GHVQ01020692.1:559-912(+)